MNDRVNDMLSDWLERSGEHSGSGRDLVERHPESTAESLVIHGLLADAANRSDDREASRIQELMARIDSELSNPMENVLTKTERFKPKSSLLKSFATFLAISAALMIMFVAFGPQQSVSAAMASLEKVVEAAAKSFDRTYTVRLIEEYPRDKRPRNLSQESWGRKAPEDIDGATIHVRSVNEFVMTVLLKAGEKRTSGCDGKVSWAFRENGPVHVTKNLNRFRGGMPGNQQDMPLLNIHANLAELKAGYDVELIEQPGQSANGSELSKLVCVRKSNRVRGSKRVEIWFDPSSGTFHRMLLDGLPRGRGGPKSVMLELKDESRLPPDFFSHESHHEPGRRVKYEGEAR